MPCQQLVCSRLPQIVGHIHDKGLDALKACAEECRDKRHGHAFVNLATGGNAKTDYCMYCLTYRVNGNVVFDPMTAKGLPKMEGDPPLK